MDSKGATVFFKRGQRTWKGASTRDEYEGEWETAFRHKYERQMIDILDTHFYVGTVHRYPKEWIIVGLFYPPKPVIRDLFDYRPPN
jgi:hypothetical protein